MGSGIGTRLRKARDRKNYSQVQVNEKTGIHNKTLSGYETGRNEPDYETLNILAELYEVKVMWLITGEEATSPTKAAQLEGIAESASFYGTSFAVPKLAKVLADHNLDLEDPETFELLEKAIEFIKFAQGKK